MIVEAARMTERKSTEDWIDSQLDRQKRTREAQEAFDAAVPAKRRCQHGVYIPRPGTCPLCEEILRNEEPTQGESIDALNASLAMMNKALKELRAAGYSIEVYGGHGDVSYFMSGGPV
jgi:hypothetical protein